MSHRRLTLPIFLATLLVPGAPQALPWPSGGSARPRGGSGALRAGVSGFKSHEKCVEELTAQLPPEAASQILGADPIELICTSRQAAAKDDAELCRRNLKDYNQRNQCLRFFAVYVGRPLDCPTRGWPTYHEGLCHALASRNPSLCLAVPSEQRALCSAILRGEGQCASLPAAQRLQCRNEAAAWRGVLKPVAATLPSSFKPEMEVRATALTSTLTLEARAAQFKTNLVDTGLLLADQAGAGDWFVLDRNFAPQETYSYSGSYPAMDLEIQVPTPSMGIGSATIGGSGGGQGKVSFRDSGSYRYRTFQASSGSVSITRFTRAAGGQVTGTFSIELTDGVDKLKLDGKFDTFVRELVSLSNVASYMRYRTGSTSSGYGGTLPPDDVKRMQERIVKVKDNVFDVDLSIRSDIIADTDKLTRGASVGKPYSPPGSSGPGGFRVYSVYHNSLMWLLGFRDSDTIKKINGRAMDSREAFYDAYTRFKKANQIVVVIERASAEVKLTYRFRKVTAKAAASKPAKKKP
jgi:hypothetical protein